VEWQLGVRRTGLAVLFLGAVAAGLEAALIAHVHTALGDQIGVHWGLTMAAGLVCLGAMFYRDPPRVPPALSGAVLSPADGVAGLSRLRRRSFRGLASGKQLARRGAHDLGPHAQLLQDRRRDSLLEQPGQQVMGPDLARPVRGGFPPRRPQAGQQPVLRLQPALESQPGRGRRRRLLREPLPRGLLVEMIEQRAIGGMEPLVDHLADDYELANRIVKAGYRVALPKVVVETFLSDYNFSQYFQHQLRWGRTVRSSRPGGYAGLVMTFGLLWSALLMIAAHGAVWSWAFMALVVILRMLVLGVSAGAVLRDGNALRNFWLLPVVDLFSPVVWLCSIFGRKIVWREKEFTLEKGKLRRRG